MINICIIDDSQIVRAVSRQSFGEFGNLIIPDNPSIISTINPDIIDLLLLDVIMPEDWINASKKLLNQLQNKTRVWLWTSAKNYKSKDYEVFTKGEENIVQIIKDYLTTMHNEIMV